MNVPTPIFNFNGATSDLRSYSGGVRIADMDTDPGLSRSEDSYPLIINPDYPMVIRGQFVTTGADDASVECSSV